MKIVADENIPHLRAFFDADELILKPGREIKKDDLLDADILLVRSVTPINKKLLEGTPIKFVGSTTSGKDHIDTQWLDENNITWYVAEGCNTRAVVEYIVCVLAALEKNELLPNNPEKRLTAVVVGVGRIGSEVVKTLEKLNFEVIKCDPYRAKDKNFTSINFAEITDVDLITFHVPLTESGEYPTFHMADKHFLLRQKKNCVIINTSRGGVIDSDALKEYGQLLYSCLDVWENEPYIDFEVLQLATIATPHIAGYSVQAKLRGIEMVYKFMREHKIILPLNITLPKYPTKEIIYPEKEISWQDAALLIFDPMQVTRDFKQAMIENESQTTFDDMRKKYMERYEFPYSEITAEET